MSHVIVVQRVLFLSRGFLHLSVPGLWSAFCCLARMATDTPLRQLRSQTTLSDAAIGRLAERGLVRGAEDQAADTSIKRLRTARQSQFDSCRVEVQFPTEDGSAWTMVSCEVSMLIEAMFNNSPGLIRLVEEADRSCPCTQSRPWTFCIGFDEFVPGNQFRPEAGRKSMVLSVYVKELGAAPARCGLAWMTPIIVLSENLKRVVGGWARVLRWFIHRLHHGPCNMVEHGAILRLSDGRPFAMFCKVGILLSDADGIRMGLDIRGAGSLRPCLKCCNVWRKSTAPRGRGMVDITCHDPSLFVPTDNDLLDDMVATLRQAKVSARLPVARALLFTALFKHVAAYAPRSRSALIVRLASKP